MTSSQNEYVNQPDRVDDNVYEMCENQFGPQPPCHLQPRNGKKSKVCCGLTASLIIYSRENRKTTTENDSQTQCGTPKLKRGWWTVRKKQFLSL